MQERTFAVATGLLLLAASLSMGLAGGPSEQASGGSFHPGVDRDPEFDVPTSPGVARVDGQRFATVQAALSHADPGDVVQLSGRFDERVTVATPNVTLAGEDPNTTVVDGGGEGHVLNVSAPGVLVRNLWIRNGGYETASNDAGVWVDAGDVTVRDSRVTEITFGIWLDGVTDVVLENNTIVGRERVTPLTDRGNGIQIWKVENATIRDNAVTDARDGLYYSWASEVTARSNTMWDLRYGVHYMYSDDCTLEGNVSFGNDVGYALMFSDRLQLRNNTAVNNSQRSGHGLLLKGIEDTVVRGNHLVANGDGIFFLNSLENTIAGNLVLDNDVGVHLTAGSLHQRVHHNSFIGNDRAVHGVVGTQVVWNTSAGNYWSGATTVDLDDDGISETQHRPLGLVETLTREHPATKVLVASPAFEVLRWAQASLPLVDSDGIVDKAPLVRPPADDWRNYDASG